MFECLKREIRGFAFCREVLGTFLLIKCTPQSLAATGKGRTSPVLQVHTLGTLLS